MRNWKIHTVVTTNSSGTTRGEARSGANCLLDIRSSNVVYESAGRERVAVGANVVGVAYAELLEGVLDVIAADAVAMAASATRLGVKGASAVGGLALVVVCLVVLLGVLGAQQGLIGVVDGKVNVSAVLADCRQFPVSKCILSMRFTTIALRTWVDPSVVDA